MLEELIGFSLEELLEKVSKEDLIEVEQGRFERHLFIGTVFTLTPSGKYYMPWSTNVTEEEANADEEWFEEVQSALSDIGLFLTSGEGNPCDMFVAKVEENNE